GYLPFNHSLPALHAGDLDRVHGRSGRSHRGIRLRLMLMLVELLPAGIFGFLLIFARVGAAFILLPVIGVSYINTRTRLALALMVTLIVYPLLAEGLPSMPAAPLMLLILL